MLQRESLRRLPTQRPPREPLRPSFLRDRRLVAVTIVLAAALTAFEIAAQDSSASEEPPVEASPAAPVTRLVLDSMPPEGSWIEITPLASEENPFVAFFEEIDPDAPLPEPIDPGLPQGPAMSCTGIEIPTTANDETNAPRAGVTCQRVFLYRGQGALGPPTPENLEITPTFPDPGAPGTPAAGTYRLGVEPVADARVGLVPADLGVERGFLLPLGRNESSRRRALRRRVATDADGRFRLPPVAAGKYFLEALLPSGRVHRSEPFELPALEDLFAAAGPEPPADLAFDLGSIDVAEGLTLTVTVVDGDGLPIEGAEVFARQGDTPDTLVTFRAVTGEDGRTTLSGFDIERPATLGCAAPEYTPARVPGRDDASPTVELVPVEWTCVLEPLARALGTVQDPRGEPPAGLTVTVLPVEGETPPPSAPSVHVQAGSGAFQVDLSAGSWTVVIAAPGLVTERLPFLATAGETNDLGLVSLLAGRETTLAVVDATTGEGIPGAVIRSLDPPGAVAAVTDAEGEALVVAPDDPPPLVEITAEAAGYAPARLRLDPGDEPRTVTLERGGWIRVVDCPGCRLRIVPGGRELATDSAGEALSPALAPRWYDVVRPSYEHLGSTVIERSDAERRRVRVRPGEVSTVRFPDRVDTLIVRADRSLEGLWRLEARTPWSAERVPPRSDGSWPLERHAEAERRDRWLSILGFDSTSRTEIRVYQGVLPASFEGETFALALGTGRLQGKIVRGGIGFSGDPATGVRVRLLRFEDGFPVAEVTTDPEGEFRVPHLQEGVYALHLDGRVYQFLSVGRGQTVDAGTFQLF